MSFFERPSFLHKDINADKDPIEPRLAAHRGGRVSVVELTSVSPELAEKAEGKILKRYRYFEWSPGWVDEFRGEEGLDYSLIDKEPELQRVLDVARGVTGRADPDAKPQELRSEIFTALAEGEYPVDKDFADRVLKEYSLTSIARRLKARHQEVTNHFKDVLPNLVVPTYYVVGSDSRSTFPATKPDNHIYELQSKVEGLTLPVGPIERFLNEASLAISPNGRNAYRMMIQRYVHKAKDHVIDRFPGKAADFKKELLAFVSTARKIPATSRLIPADIVYPQNLFFTKDGLRVIDCNGAFRIPKRPNSDTDVWQRSYQSAYHALLEMWEMLGNEL